jgi:hypothetical protein
MNTLRHLQDEISQEADKTSSDQDFEQTISGIRRVSDAWKPPTLINNLRRLETQISTLDEHEARIMERCKAAGLV